MTRPIGFICLGLLILWTEIAQAQYPMEKSSWRTAVTINEPWGPTTYKIWMDKVGTGPNNVTIPWDPMQRLARREAWRCDPTIWGQQTSDDAEAWRGDQYYIPLHGFTFVPVNIEVAGPLPPDHGPSWRVPGPDSLYVYPLNLTLPCPQDSLILFTSDGRRLVSFPPQKVYEPELSWRTPSTRWIITCKLYARNLGGATLFNRDQLDTLARYQPEFYIDHPTANTFLVPMQNEGKEFNLDDVRGAYITFRGRRIDFQLADSLLSVTPFGH